MGDSHPVDWAILGDEGQQAFVFAVGPRSTTVIDHGVLVRHANGRGKFGKADPTQKLIDDVRSACSEPWVNLIIWRTGSAYCPSKVPVLVGLKFAQLCLLNEHGDKDNERD